MNKLLVNTPNGMQEIVMVGEGGGYFESDLIESDIQASLDPANFDVANSPRWPL